MLLSIAGVLTTSASPVYMQGIAGGTLCRIRRCNNYKAVDAAIDLDQLLAFESWFDVAFFFAWLSSVTGTQVSVIDSFIGSDDTTSNDVLNFY